MTNEPDKQDIDGSEGRKTGAQSTRQRTQQSNNQNDGMAGQPIGGNDSATGTGTTLTQGADLAGEISMDQRHSGGHDATIAKQDERSFGQGTTSNAGGSTVGTDQTSGGSSGTSGGEGFIGSQRASSDDDLGQDGSSDEHVLEEDPGSKHGDEGEAVHGGEQAGPNSSRAGQPIAPQMGDPRAKDRRPN